MAMRSNCPSARRRCSRVLMSAPRQIFTRRQLLDAVFDGVDSSAPSTRMSITCDASSAGASSARCTALAIALEPNDARQ